MCKYENALVEILNGLGRYDLFPIEAKNEPKYILYISTDFDDDIEIEISKEVYEVLVQLDEEINGKEE